MKKRTLPELGRDVVVMSIDAWHGEKGKASMVLLLNQSLWEWMICVGLRCVPLLFMLCERSSLCSDGRLDFY